MKKLFPFLLVGLLSSHVFAINFDSIGEVEEVEEVEEAPAPAPKPVAKTKKAPAKKSSPSTTVWSIGVNYNPLANISGVDPNSGMDTRMVEGNMVVDLGVQFSPAYRLGAKLGYNSNKYDFAGTTAFETSLISIGLSVDYFMKQTAQTNTYIVAGLDYLMASSKAGEVTTDATGYVLGVGVGSEFKFSPSFAIGADLKAKYGVGTKAADNPAEGSPEIKNTSIWLAPALKLTWYL